MNTRPAGDADVRRANRMIDGILIVFLTLMIVTQLVTIGTFVIFVNRVTGFDGIVLGAVSIIAVAIELFGMPRLLRMPLSRAQQRLSIACLMLLPFTWAFLALGAYAPLLLYAKIHSQMLLQATRSGILFGEDGLLLALVLWHFIARRD